MREKRITAILTEGLRPIHLEVRDDSQKHSGHAGARPGGETHFSVTVTAECFTGLNKVNRHQKIYALLDGEFKSGLHALAIDAKAPGEG